MLRGTALTEFISSKTGIRWGDSIIEGVSVELIYLKYLTAPITYENMTRVEAYPFPKDAVREALYNALVHSQRSAGILIQIRIEDDAMYIRYWDFWKKANANSKLLTPNFIPPDSERIFAFSIDKSNHMFYTKHYCIPRIRPEFDFQ